jgi:hypothetical protein
VFSFRGSKFGRFNCNISNDEKARKGLGKFIHGRRILKWMKKNEISEEKASRGACVRESYESHYSNLNQVLFVCPLLFGGFGRLNGNK